MQVEVSAPSEWQRQITIQIEPESVADHYQAAVKKLRKEISLPGFRKGHVPVGLIRSRFGDSLAAEVLESIVSDSWEAALEEHDLTPVAQPEFEEVPTLEQIKAPDGPMTIRASVEVKPAIEISGYKDMSLVKEIPRVLDDDVQRVLSDLQNRRAKIETVEREAAFGDIIVADIQVTDPTGVPLLGKNAEDQSWELGGEQTFSSEADEQLQGAVAGDVRKVQFTYASDFHDQTRAGTTEHAQITVKEIREKRLPELNDEFAKAVGDFDDLAALKTQVRKNLEQEEAQQASNRLRDTVRQNLLTENEFEVPDSMIERYLDAMVEDEKQRHEGHDHSVDEGEIREQGRSHAIGQIRTMWMLEAVAKQEDISLSDDEFETHISTMAASFQMDPRKLKSQMEKTGRLEETYRRLLDDKVYSYLEGAAEVEEVFIDRP